MSLDDLLAGDAVFVDANIFTYHFQPHPTWGSSCTKLLHRIENRELEGFTTIPVLLTTRHSPLATRHSPLTTHHSPLTTHPPLDDN